MVGSILRRWWLRLTGRAAEPDPVSASPRATGGRQHAPDAEKPGELRVVDDPPTGAGRGKPDHPGAGGFDPYSSDAGYQKPHSWERVDHD